MPAWMGPVAAGAVSGLAQGLLSAGPDQQQITSMVPIARQPQLLNQMLRRAIAGEGEYGFGRAARQGAATLSDMLGQRGIAPESGVASSALAQMLAQAADYDARNRFAQNLALIRAQPWTDKAQHFGGSYYNQYVHGIGPESQRGLSQRLIDVIRPDLNTRQGGLLDNRGAVQPWRRG